MDIPIRYAGYYYDSETNLYYLKARYYSPELGRFITKDNIDYSELNNPQSLNLYAYSNNNPILKIDPDGHNPIIAALRLLVKVGWKEGKHLAKKGWAIAKPFVSKAIKNAKRYKLEGPGDGRRIIQVGYQSTGSVIFRLDYFPIKHGGPYRLHYHI